MMARPRPASPSIAVSGSASPSASPSPSPPPVQATIELLGRYSPTLAMLGRLDSPALALLARYMPTVDMLGQGTPRQAPAAASMYSRSYGLVS